MRVGFTGTREGLAEAQSSKLRVSLWEIFFGHDERAFHHGCCVGADEQAVGLFRELHIPECADPEEDDLGRARTPYIVAHLPDDDSRLSSAALDGSDSKRKPKPYLDRNRDIVDACEVLVACPKGPEEQRSGTWSTVRYARKQGKRIVIIWPDGTVTEEPARTTGAT